jgi:hypothetical protein
LTLNVIILSRKVIPLLGYWRNHCDYQKFMIDNINREFKHNPHSIDHYETAILKMYHLNSDCIVDDFIPLFSSTGRPSNQQPEIFRSFILMSHFKYHDLDDWISFAKSSVVISSLIGVSPDNFPGESTHRDFYTRLWLADSSKQSRTRKPEIKPKSKHGNNKIPPKHPGIIKELTDKALSGESFKNIPERLYQALFAKVALFSSAKMGLLGDISKLFFSADGACVHSNASPYGRKICGCTDKCSCDRLFSDPDANWGWDSYHKQWFFGHTAYLFSVHNSDLKIDLPIYLRFAEGSAFDGVTLIQSLAHARYLYDGFLSFDSLIADAAHDNYPTYDLLKRWNIKPFIALNNRTSEPGSTAGSSVQKNKNGVPICADGHEMANWGFDAKRYRIKYRCPFVTGRVKYCFYDSCCNKSFYGKQVYINLAEDLRMYTPVPRGSDEWNIMYKLRTASERVNNRILTDYILEYPKRYGKKKLSFFAFLNAINVHLDAQVKFNNVTLDSLIN